MAVTAAADKTEMEVTEETTVDTIAAEVVASAAAVKGTVDNSQWINLQYDKWWKLQPHLKQNVS